MTRDDVLRDLDTVLGTNIYPPADVDPTATTRRIGSESVPVFPPPAGPVTDDRFTDSSLKGESVESSRFGDGGAQPLRPNRLSESVRLVRFEELHDFAAVDELGAEPLLGTEDVCVLSLDGVMTTYGTGGAAKTTAAVDRAAHYAAGDPWLGLDVSEPRRVLILENEGPRGRFRLKLRAKLASWTGSPIEKGRVQVFTSPWGMFRFDQDQLRTELVEQIDEFKIDVVVAGPIKRLGVQGGGTPEEVQAFLLLLEQVKLELGRPLAYDLTHHTNKTGSVSGDWEGTGDTLVRLDKRGPGATALTWEKVRWGSELQGVAWKLLWRDGERYVIDETPERTEGDIADEMLAFVEANPGTTWTKCQKSLGGTADTNKEIRDRLLDERKLINANADNDKQAMPLFLPGQAPVEQTTLEKEET